MASGGARHELVELGSPQKMSRNCAVFLASGVPGLSLGVVCVILRLAVLIQYLRVTNTHTHTR